MTERNCYGEVLIGRTYRHVISYSCGICRNRWMVGAKRPERYWYCPRCDSSRATVVMYELLTPTHLKEASIFLQTGKLPNRIETKEKPIWSR
jgi:hypothetical protein